MRRPRLPLILLLAAAAFSMAMSAAAAPRRRQARAPRAAGPAMAPVAADDLNLADWTRQPFSDLASHGVLWRDGPGLLAWRLNTATAFGSLAAAPHPAKALLDMDLSLVVEGEAQPRFTNVTATVKSWPLWAEESAVDGALQAEAVTLFSATDVVVAAVNIRNAGTTPLRLRPCLRLRRDGEGLKAAAELSARYPAYWIELDRSAAAGRRLVEHAGAWMGAQAWRGSADGQPVEARKNLALEPGKDLELELTWNFPQLLAPGQTLRVPVLLAWGPDRDALMKTAVAQWEAAAVPKGLAWAAARARWARIRARLPQVDPAHARLLRRAVVNLMESDYAPRASLSADEFSAQKGVRDAFFSVDTPLAALGWAELDLAKAEGAVLDLASFSAAAPAAVPPYTGEEKLQWEAAGLPLNAWVAWELYHRDPQPARAAQFLSRFGERLRNECAWWQPNRDGDGNGLFAFARDEEKPLYMRRQTPPTLPVLWNLSATANALAGVTPTATVAPSLQTWSLALTSLLAWQYQAGAAMAQAGGNAAESEQWMGLAHHSQQAIQTAGWDKAAGAYVQGMDGLWPLLLGLEPDDDRAKAEIEGFLQLTATAAPWQESGVWEPWRVYVAARTLACYGYFDASHAMAERFLGQMEQKTLLSSEYGDPKSESQGGSAATAAVITQLLLERQEQEVFLTKFTGEFEARWLQFRSLDGSFYMKRTKIQEKEEKYAQIKVETPKKGKILDENSFIFSSPEPMTIQIQTEVGVNISKMAAPSRLIFKDAHRVEMLVPAKTRILVRFTPEPKRN